jgi:hypothetical protein
MPDIGKAGVITRLDDLGRGDAFTCRRRARFGPMERVNP